MTTASVFSTLDLAQLYALKSQYLASLQLIDQMDTALKAQSADVGKARKQLEESMRELDHELAGGTSSKPAPRAEPAKPVRRASRRPARMRSTATEPDPD